MFRSALLKHFIFNLGNSHFPYNTHELSIKSEQRSFCFERKVVLNVYAWLARTLHR